MFGLILWRSITPMSLFFRAEAVELHERFLEICNRAASRLVPRTISDKELLKRLKTSFPRVSTGFPKDITNIQQYIQKIKSISKMGNLNIQKSNALPLCMAHAREAGRPDPERFLQRFKGFSTRRSEFKKYFLIFWQCGSASAVFFA